VRKKARAPKAKRAKRAPKAKRAKRIVLPLVRFMFRRLFSGLL
jgi:hypothetical protein